MEINHFKIFDAHFHIIDPRFPLIANNGYVPDAFTCDNYLKRMKGYTLVGGAVVTGSFQEFDQSYLLNALEVLGPSFCGVTQIPADTPDEKIMRLNKAGVRAVRFNLKRGGSEVVQHLDRLARRVHELAGWHTELHVDSSELKGLYDTLVTLPAVCIDHLGLSGTGFKTLLRLVGRGVHVKATGFGRVDFDVPRALKEIYAANPKALMFGTDLPSTRAPRPFLDEDMAVVIETLGETGAGRVLYENAVNFYAHR
jgi:predicted TIM-barrel fold metal-dependent hydrolase